MIPAIKHDRRHHGPGNVYCTGFVRISYQRNIGLPNQATHTRFDICPIFIVLINSRNGMIMVKHHQLLPIRQSIGQHVNRNECLHSTKDVVHVLGDEKPMRTSLDISSPSRRCDLGCTSNTPLVLKSVSARHNIRSWKTDVIHHHKANLERLL